LQDRILISGEVAEMTAGPQPQAIVDESVESQGTDVDGRPMRADARRNYERLVGAAREVFAESGGDASMDAIAKHAGVGVGTLYRHFPKRINIVEAVYRTDVDELVAAAERLVEEPDPWAAVVGWLQAFVRYAQTKRTLINELHEAFEKNPQLRLASRERIEGALAIVLHRAQQAGVARTDVDESDLIQLLSSICMSATVTADQSERLLGMIEDGLRPPS
jgi:AcrR family transcriptional regulator